jgi:hypothetical protein
MSSWLLVLTSTSTSYSPGRRFVATIDQMVPAVFLGQLLDAPNIGFHQFGLLDDWWLVEHLGRPVSFSISRGTI